MTLALFVLLLLVLSNFLHLLVVRHNLLARWRVPISRRWFGENKTLRGFIVLLMVNGVASIPYEPLMPELDAVEAFAARPVHLPGLPAVGAADLVSQAPTGHCARCEATAQPDLVIGILLFGALVHDLPWRLLLPAGTVAVVLHLSISALLVRCRVKASAVSAYPHLPLYQAAPSSTIAQ